MIKCSKVLAAVGLVCMLVQLGGCGNSPVRNPLKSTPKTVLGPLPEIEEHKKTHASMLWNEKITRGSSYFGKIRPVISSQVVYQADHKGVLVALSKDRGTKIWRKMTHHPISSGPVLINNTLIVGTTNGKVLAFHPYTGEELWQARVPSEVLAPPQGNEQTLLVSTIDGQLTALNPQNGQQLWQYERTAVPALILRGGSSPVMAGNHAYAGFANGKFVALNLKNGDLDWEKTITTPRGRSELQRMVDIQANPVILGNDVYVASYQGNITALSLDSGQVQWQRKVSSYKDMMVDDKAVYITDQEFHVWALDRQNGGTLWKQAALERRLITGPTLTPDYLVVGDHGGYVHWMRKTDGQLMGHFSIGKRILQKPVADGNLILVTAADGETTALVLEPLFGEGV